LIGCKFGWSKKKYFCCQVYGYINRMYVHLPLCSLSWTVK